MKCGGGLSFFLVNSEGRNGSALSSSLSNICLDLNVLCRVVHQGYCGASIASIKVTHFDVTDDGVIFVELLEVS